MSLYRNKILLQRIILYSHTELCLSCTRQHYIYTFKLRTSHMIWGHILSWSKSALLKQQSCADVHQLKFWPIFQNNKCFEVTRATVSQQPDTADECRSHKSLQDPDLPFLLKIDPSQKWCIASHFYCPWGGRRWKEEKGSKGVGLESVSETAKTTKL